MRRVRCCALLWLRAVAVLAMSGITGCGRDRAEPHPGTGTSGGVYRFSAIPETVLVPAGEFVMGDDLGDPSERPRRIVTTAAFRIGKFPVTNEQYAVFTAATGHRSPRYAGDPRCNRPRQAVVGVNIRDAQAYCAWLSSVTGRVWRLPTEAEWEKAARGTDGRMYPWGDEPPTPKIAHIELSERMPDVGSYPRNVSPYGCYDMVGNVWQWCSDEFRISSATSRRAQSVRGGNWVFLGCCGSSPESSLRVVRREGFHPDLQKKTIGFRVVQEVAPDEVAEQ